MSRAGGILRGKAVPEGQMQKQLLPSNVASMNEFLEQARPALVLALEEDIGGGDVTTLATIPAGLQAKGQFLAKSSGIIAGLDVVALLQ